ncbi:MAG: VWA domain-containing protein [Candidatus Omnitrophica bacterium]|nr:VWA domain-containing protein [Candidatus Omnitrophota bacterium]
MKTLKFMTMALLLSAGMVRADGLIVIPNPVHPGSTPYPLEVKYHHVEVEIGKNRIAKTNISQEFYNPTGSRLEGMYIFPVPDGAVLSGFSMDINGREVPAELLPADKAKKIYEDIVRKMKDPALLEYSGRDAFKVRIYPIEPRSTKKVNIGYGQLLKSDAGMLNYVYPLNTEKFSSKPVEEVSIRINLETKEKIKTLYCPTHEIKIRKQDGYRAAVNFEEKNVLPDKDFSFYYSTDKADLGVGLLTHKTAGEDGFFILNVSPSDEPAYEKVLQKNIVFVIDTSGSMAGKKLEQAKNALIFCIENLNKKDRFEIIRFSTEAENLFGSLKTADGNNLNSAKTFIENMRPIGGTNIEEALSRAFSSMEADREKKPSNIIFITDGKPTIGMTDEDGLAELVRKANKNMARVFVFGIDYGINTHLLDRIAEISAGYRTYVTPEENLELKLSSFYEKIKFPVFSNLSIDFGGLKVKAAYPKKLPDLFKNSPVIITGRYKKGGSTKITLEGIIAGGSKKFEYTLDFPPENTQNEFIPQIWAAQHIGYLLDEIRLNGENTETKDEIIEVARKYGIITPYTSFLIMEEEDRRRADGDSRPAVQLLRNEVAADKLLNESMRKDYGGIREKEGKGSVAASSEIYSLQNAVNSEQIYQGRERLSYMDGSGNRQNLASQMKNIQGRAVYQSSNIWIDSEIQNVRNANIKKIQFASAEYFELIDKEPESAQFLSLGRNVQFLLNNTVYEIYE